MKRIVSETWLVAVSLLAFSSVAWAHHGTGASYDLDKEITLTGTVTEFNWANPHTQIYFDVKDETGNVIHWAAENSSPGVLGKAGWSRTSLKPGDQITIIVNPSKAGTPVGVVVKVLRSDGTTLSRR